MALVTASLEVNLLRIILLALFVYIVVSYTQLPPHVQPLELLSTCSSGIPHTSLSAYIPYKASVLCLCVLDVAVADIYYTALFLLHFRSGSTATSLLFHVHLPAFQCHPQVLALAFQSTRKTHTRSLQQ